MKNLTLLNKVFDAMAKLPSGLFKANINWVGSFKSCQEVSNTQVLPAIKGKYCNAFIGFPIDQVAVNQSLKLFL